MSKSHLIAELLGRPLLSWQGEIIRPRSEKACALLYTLAVRGEAVERSTLAELLWGEGRYHNLRQVLSALRHLPGAEHWLEDGDPLSLHVACDVSNFETAVTEGRYADALTLWRGPLLTGVNVANAPAFTDWLEVERRRLTGLLRHALQGRAAQLAEAGQTGAALELLYRLLELDPLDESAHRTVMRLEFARGHLQAALAQYERCCRVLLEELGVEPMAETRALADLIAQGNLSPLPEARATRMPPQLLRPPVLVGREREWSGLETAWRDSKVIFITGPAGMGKTRLMLDFARSKGRYLLNEGRPTDAALPFSSLARGLRLLCSTFPDFLFEPWVKQALARIAPRTFPDVTPSDQAVGKARLIDAWLWTMKELESRVNALPADDIHYFDSASAEVAASVSVGLVQEDPRSWRHISAFREKEMPSSLLHPIYQSAEVGVNAIIDLRPLSPSAVSDLLDGLELPGADNLAAKLHSYTGGNPTFVIEVLKDLYSRGKLEPEVTHFEVPERITTLIVRRLDALEPSHLRLLRVVAVLRPDSPLELIAKLLDLTAMEVAEGLGKLEEQQFLRGRRFAHDLLYEAVLGHTPSAVLSLLHQRAAETLETENAESAHIAYHYAAAEDFEKAVPHWLAAAQAYIAAGFHDKAATALRQVVTHTTDAESKHKAQHDLARAQAEPSES